VVYTLSRVNADGTPQAGFGTDGTVTTGYAAFAAPTREK